MPCRAAATAAARLHHGIVSSLVAFPQRIYQDRTQRTFEYRWHQRSHHIRRTRRAVLLHGLHGDVRHDRHDGEGGQRVDAGHDPVRDQVTHRGRPGRHGVGGQHPAQLLHRHGIREGRSGGLPRDDTAAFAVAVAATVPLSVIREVEDDGGDPAHVPLSQFVVVGEEGLRRVAAREQVHVAHGGVGEARPDEAPVRRRRTAGDAPGDSGEQADVCVEIGRHMPSLRLVPLGVVQGIVEKIPPAVRAGAAGRRGRVEDVYGGGLLEERKAVRISTDGVVEYAQGVRHVVSILIPSSVGENSIEMILVRRVS